jgi:hypothetical protein
MARDYPAPPCPLILCLIFPSPSLFTLSPGHRKGRQPGCLWLYTMQSPLSCPLAPLLFLPCGPGAGAQGLNTAHARLELYHRAAAPAL